MFFFFLQYNLYMYIYHKVFGRNHWLHSLINIDCTAWSTQEVFFYVRHVRSCTAKVLERLLFIQWSKAALPPVLKEYKIFPFIEKYILLRIAFYVSFPRTTSKSSPMNTDIFFTRINYIKYWIDGLTYPFTNHKSAL